MISAILNLLSVFRQNMYIINIGDIMFSYSKASNWITDQIYATVTGVEPEKREVIEYGAYMALSEISKIGLLIIISLFLNVFWYVFGIIMLFGLLRWNLGGVHAKTHWACLLSYFCIIYGTLGASFLLSNHRLVFDIIIIPFSFFVSYKYAPADMPVKPVSSKKQRKRLRITGFILLAVLFILAQFANLILFNIIMLTIAITAVLMTPPIYKLTNNVYGS
jgi:accessory gene regulator B